MKKIILTLIAMMFITSCGTFEETVPPGYLGMIMTKDGLEEEILNPGNHTCWGRDKMIITETKELSVEEKLSVLCADDLNFKFTLVTLSSLKKDPKTMARIITKQGSDISWDGKKGKLKYRRIYNTYLRPIVRSTARTVISKYETTQIRENRSKIQKTIQENILVAIANLPVKVTMVTTSNFDYPTIITTSMEKKRTREIQLQEEKAKQAIKLLEATNRLKIAQKMKVVRMAEAEAESAYIKIMGHSLNPMYLKMKEIEAKYTLYKKVGKGDKVIVTNEKTAAMPILNRRAVVYRKPTTTK